MKVVTIKMTRVKKKPGLWVCCPSLQSVTSCPANACEWRHFHLSLREVVSSLRLAQFYPTSRLVLLPQIPKDVVREHDSRRMRIMFPAREELKLDRNQICQKKKAVGKGDLLMTVDVSEL